MFKSYVGVAKFMQDWSDGFIAFLPENGFKFHVADIPADKNDSFSNYKFHSLN